MYCFHGYSWRPPPEELYSDVPVLGLMTVYVVIFLLCSVLSLAFHGYFYCICLLHVIVNNDILQRVLKSITKNGESSNVHIHTVLVARNLCSDCPILDLIDSSQNYHSNDVLRYKFRDGSISNKQGLVFFPKFQLF